MFESIPNWIWITYAALIIPSAVAWYKMISISVAWYGGIKKGGSPRLLILIGIVCSIFWIVSIPYLLHKIFIKGEIFF